MNNVANFFDSKEGDRKYTAEDFRNWLKGFLTNGVVANQLFVQSGEEMNVVVNPGFAFINGYWKRFDATTLEVQPAASGATNERIDSVVIELNTESEDMTLKVVQNQQTPVRSGNVYQLMIAKIYVPASATTSAYNLTQSKIEDTRADSNSCGYIVRFMSDYNFSDELEQLEYFENYMKEDAFEEFDDWFAEAQSVFTPNVVADLRGLITALKNRISNESDKLDDETDEAVSLSNRWEAVKPFSKKVFEFLRIPDFTESSNSNYYYNGAHLKDLVDTYGIDNVVNYNIIGFLTNVDWDNVIGAIASVQLFNDGTNVIIKPTSAFNNMDGTLTSDLFFTRHDYNNAAGDFGLRAGAEYFGSGAYSKTLAAANSDTPTTTTKTLCHLYGGSYELVRTKFEGKPDALSIAIVGDVTVEGYVTGGILKFERAIGRDATNNNAFHTSYMPGGVTYQPYWVKVGLSNNPALARTAYSGYIRPNIILIMRKQWTT